MSPKLDARLRALEAAADRPSADRALQSADDARARIMARLDHIAAASGCGPAPADPAKLAEIRGRLLALQSPHGGAP